MKYDFEKIEKELEIVAREAAEKEIKAMEERGFQYSIHNGNDSKPVDFLYDVCGGAYVYLKDGRKSFARQYSNYHLRKYGSESYGHFSLYPSFGRQELCFHKAVANAVSNYINEKYGAESRVKSYID